MKQISVHLYRRLPWLNLPATMLIALLQRTPVLRIAAVADEFVASSPFGTVLRTAAATLAALGAVDSMAGATAVTSSTASPLAATVGSKITDVAFDVTGTAGPASSWTVTGTIPPGLDISTLTGSGGTLNLANPDLEGTPTTAGSYQFTLVAGYMGLSSPAFTYTVNVSAATSPPSFTTQPQSQTVTVGQSVTFTAAASGSPTFQWQKNSANISGATSATLMLTNVQTTDAGTYTVVATNSAGSATSTDAMLTVNPATSPPSFTTQPQSQTVTAGGSVTFTAAASGSPTFQWQKNSANISGATSATLMLTNVQTTDAGTYTVVATNSAGSATSTGALLTVNPASSAPVITLQPAAQTIQNGSTVVFNVAASGSPAYQWQFNGANISGATSALLVISPASPGNAGNYTCVVSNAAGSVTSSAAMLTVANVSGVGHLINLSIRTNAGSGAQTLIVGFVVTGSAGEPLLIRATGPALIPFGVTGVLADPVLNVFNQKGVVVASNDNWGGNAQITSVDQAVGAFPLADPTSLDAALYQSSQSAGPYTAQITGNGGGTGVALAEVYDATPAGTYNQSSPRLINVSARAQVGTGANILIAGFVIGGSTSKTLLIRATGPALTQYGVTGVLPDPGLQLYQGSNVIASNSGWGGDSQLSAVGNSVGAFAINDPNSKDSVLLVTLPPGVYTAQVKGVSGDTGVALVEVYDVP